MILIKDKIVVNKYTIDDSTGFLTVPVVFSRTGIQQYTSDELGLSGDDIVNVYRPPEEVFDEKSIKTFINLPITNDHVEGLDVSNIKDYQVGSVSHPKRVDDRLTGIATLTDKEQIQRFVDGKKEVSVGYFCDMKKKEGSYEGEKYKYIQKNIRANHLAIVNQGRCGSTCKLGDEEKTNKKEKNNMKVVLDEISYDIGGENQALYQKIESLKKIANDHKSTLKMLDEKQAKIDALSASIIEMKKAILDEDQLQKLISDRASLIIEAKSLLKKDELPQCDVCPQELKKAVIKKALPTMALDGKDESYINASYDIAVAQLKESRQKQDNLAQDFQKTTFGELTIDKKRENLRKKWLEKEGYEGDDDNDTK